MAEPVAMMYVYRLPDKLSNGYCFGAGVPITFTNVDWMGAHEGLSKEEVWKFVKAKRYMETPGNYLVLSLERPELTAILTVRKS